MLNIKKQSIFAREEKRDCEEYQDKGGVLAVSYTHLDVYKRQPCGLVLCWALPIPTFVTGWYRTG